MKTFFKRLNEQGFFMRLPNYLLMMVAGPVASIAIIRETMQTLEALQHEPVNPYTALSLLVIFSLMWWIFNLMWQNKFFIKWATLLVGLAIGAAMWEQGTMVGKTIIVDASVVGYLVLYCAPVIWIAGMLDYVWENYVPAVVQWFMMDNQEREKAKLEEAL